MKRIICLVIAVLCFGGNVFAVLNGNGTEANPYLIQSRADFDEFANFANASIYWASDKYTKLMCDIDLSNTTYTQAVIAPDTVSDDYANFDGTPFNGFFDGNKHIIANLTIDQPNRDYMSLFGLIEGGQIKNLGVENVYIIGHWCIGGLAGYNGGSITNCYVTGSITGSYIGGLCGWNLGSVAYSYVAGKINGPECVGGFVGENDGTFTSCFWDTQTSGQYAGVGAGSSSGVTGKQTTEMQTLSTFTSAGWDFTDIWKLPDASYPRLSNVVATPTFSLSGGTYSNVQNVIITCATEDAIIHYTTNGLDPTEGDPTFATGDSVQLAVNATTILKARAFKNGWTRSAINKKTYIIQPPYSGGTGTSQDPYKIANVDDFLQLSKTPTDWDKSFILIADIDLESLTFTQAPIAPDTINDNYCNLTGTAFTGVFDGKCHVISNLTINQTNNDYVGLIGWLDCGHGGGMIKNLGLENIEVSGRYYVGGLVGINLNGSISDCYVTGTVSGFEVIGGLCGYNSSNITHSFAACRVTGTDFVGGLVGREYASNITTCFWDKQVSGKSVGVGYGSSSGVTGKYTAEMQTLSTFTSAGWDFINIWKMAVGSYPKLLNSNVPVAPYPVVYIDVTGGINGRITIELYPDKAPITVDNFLQYVKDNFYDGLIFHRVINNFMIQGGGYYVKDNIVYLASTDPNKLLRAPIINESNNQLSNLRGTISMERASDPNSATSQFFINQEDNHFLDYNNPLNDYDPNDKFGRCVFGRVVSGMDIVDDIAQVATKNELSLQNLPVVPIIIKNISLKLSGSGTQLKPYLIQSRADFNEFANPANASIYWASGRYTMLMCDIDLTVTQYTQAPIAPDTIEDDYAYHDGIPFAGVFDGSGHVISNLTINQPSKDYLGLFGWIHGGEIKNLGVENFNLTGHWVVGGLIGWNEGSITNCYVTGAINGSYIGGLCGYNSGTIAYSFSAGSVGGPECIGGFVGGNDGTLMSCFWDTQTSGQYAGVGGGSSSGLIGKKTPEMQTPSMFTSAGWQIPDVWILSGDSYPKLSITVAIPVFSLNSGTYVNAQNVIITCRTEYAAIHYTTNGLDPTEDDPVVISGEPVLLDVNTTITLKAKAFKAGLSPSETKSATYFIQPATVSQPVFSPDSGTYDNGQRVIITCATEGATIRYTTNGLDTTEDDPVVISGESVLLDMNTTTTLKAKAFKVGCNPSDIKTATYIIQPAIVPTPTFFPDDGTYNTSQLVTITCEDTEAIIHYTTNGIDPTENDPSIINGYSVEIPVNTTTMLRARAFKEGSNPSAVRMATYIIKIYSGGTGTAEHPYQIANVADFQQLSTTSSDWDKSFILTADINLASLTFAQSPIGTNNGGATMDYVGTPFTGVFDGNNHIISHLNIATSDNIYIGLIGRLGIGGQVRNLGIKDVNITGNDYIGGLIGYNDQGTITGCNVSGFIYERGKDPYGTRAPSIGGLIGYDDHGILTSCYATGTVGSICQYSTVGGLIGSTNYGILNSCYANVSVIGTGYNNHVGGLIGGIYHGSLTSCYATGLVTVTDGIAGGLAYYNSGTLMSCYATGSVISSSESIIGGLTGTNSGTIISCHATGEVNGKGFAGGLTGSNADGGIIRNCYSTGSVTGVGYVGGLVGSNDNGSVTSCYATGFVSGVLWVGGLVGDNAYGLISSCYANGSVLGSSNDVGGLAGVNNGTVTNCYSTGIVVCNDSVGGLIGCSNWGVTNSSFWDIQGSGWYYSNGGTGKMTLQMMTLSTFTAAGWDFSTTDGNPADWQMPAISYPRLAWETVINNQDANITGDYWYGCMGSDSLYLPETSSGTCNISNTAIMLYYDNSYGGHEIHNISINGQRVDDSGWINLLVAEAGSQSLVPVASNNTLLYAADREPSYSPEHTIMLKKANNLPLSEIQGDWAFFGHAVDTIDKDATMTYGQLHFGNGTFNANVSDGTGENTIISNAPYIYNIINATLTLPQHNREFRVGNGMMIYFDVDTSDDELFYDILVKKSSGKTLANLEGQWLYQEYVTDVVTARPQVGWGTVAFSAEGKWVHRCVYNDAGVVSTGSNSGTVVIESNGDLTINDIDGHIYKGILSQDSNTIVVSQFGQYGQVGVGILVRTAGKSNLGQLLDINSIRIKHGQDFYDGLPLIDSTYAIPGCNFSIEVQGTGITSVEVTLPNYNKIDLQDYGDGLWGIEDGDFNTIDDLYSAYPMGQYSFSFNNGVDIVIVDHNDLQPDAANITYPANDACNVPYENPVFTWNFSGTGEVLYVYAENELTRKKIGKYNLQTDITSQTMEGLEPAQPYYFGITVINDTNTITHTSQNDSFAYRSGFETFNHVTFRTEPITGDFDLDGDVDFIDLQTLASAWLSMSGDANWNKACDISEPNDNIVNMKDFTVFAQHWFESGQ